MNITRRVAIRNLLIVTAGAAILPSCFQDGASVKLKNIKINRDQEDSVASLTDAIIPKTDTPGAVDIAAHLFVLKMVDDCYTKEEQVTFVKGLEEFNKLTKLKYESNFAELNPVQKKELLTSLEKDEKLPEEIRSFYFSVKDLTILGFTTSQYYLTEVKKYNIIPGKYQGSVPVTNPISEKL
ncbi:MAG: gluconate 2-dehydrogenase subunit 3 family protein [Flavobacterium sp.]|nr:gluconate 2-dehydrogenase subunit 3 family protein [Pedobacter sp.]